MAWADLMEVAQEKRLRVQERLGGMSYALVMSRLHLLTGSHELEIGTMSDITCSLWSVAGKFPKLGACKSGGRSVQEIVTFPLTSL